VSVSAAVAALFLGALVALAPASAPPGRSIHVGGIPLELVGTRASLWVLTCDRRCSGEARTSVGRIVRIDARAGRVLASVPISRPHALAVGSGGVYALDFWRDTVLRLDPQTLRTTARLRLVLPFEVVPGDDAFLPFDVAVGPSGVWVSTARGALAHVDLRLGRVLEMVRLPGKATGEIAVGAGAVWVAASLFGVYRVDPSAHRVVARVRIGPSTNRLAVDTPVVGERKVFAVGAWTRNGVLTGRRGLARIDPRRTRLEAVTALPSGPLAVAYGKGSLWVARVGGSSVERIAPASGTVIERFRTDDAAVITVASRRVWIATRDGTIHRIAAP
jgi:streptogramin lyase